MAAGSTEDFLNTHARVMRLSSERFIYSIPYTQQIVKAHFSSAVSLCMRASSNMTGTFLSKSAAGVSGSAVVRLVS